MTKFAMLFPGQGSQSCGMLQALALQNPLIKQTFDEASEVLNCDLFDIVLHNPDDLLNQTAYTQPILLAASVALWRIWSSQVKVNPAFMAGHSLGEYSALVCAESLSFTDAVQVVHARGRLMQAAVPPEEGAMAAIIGLSDEAVLEACEVADLGHVAPANYNAYGQVVISGTRVGVLRAMDNAKSLGAKLVKLLPVSVPSHSQLMKPAADSFKEVLVRIVFVAPKIPVIHNVDMSLAKEGASIRQKLIEQLYSPVRWVETIEFLGRQGVYTAYECGPGKVLAGLNKRILKDFVTYEMDTLESLSAAVETLA